MKQPHNPARKAAPDERNPGELTLEATQAERLVATTKKRVETAKADLKHAKKALKQAKKASKKARKLHRRLAARIKKQSQTSAKSKPAGRAGAGGKSRRAKPPGKPGPMT